MRIQLKQNEIESAITSFLNCQGITVEGKDINMLFTSGRKNNGLSVEVMIEDAAVAPDRRGAQIPRADLDKIMTKQEQAVPKDQPSDAVVDPMPAPYPDVEATKVSASAGSLFG